MSHLKLKVNNQTPNNIGDITVNLSNIITVNSPAIGQLLQKASTDWKTGTLTAGASGLLNNLATTSAGNIAYKYDVEDNYISRKASNEYNIVNKLTLQNASASSYIPVGSTSWTMGYKLLASEFPSGSVILFRALIGPFRSSASNITIQWYKGSPYTGLSSNTPIGNKAFSNEDYGATALGLFESDGTDTWAMIRVVAKTGDTAITSGLVASIQQITAKQLA